jgi:eukaryotic-like serine/threonine-protein kinase
MQARLIDGKYRIVRELSKGGMGAVYEALHVLTRRKVALKLILPDRLGRDNATRLLRRFQREARAAGSIDSRHVVSVLDTGVDASTNHHYIVMELLSGEDLRQLVRRVGALRSELVLRIAAQVCLGLHSAHEQGIVHRDIKAGNIYLARRDAGQVEVKVLDFGIAKLKIDPLESSESHDLTRSGAVLGSPSYMSPEQATGSGNLDKRTDIWSLGVVMYEALCGETPHGYTTLGALILAICSRPAPPLRERAPWVSAEVAAIVHKALALEPGQRFQTAEAMRGDISALISGDATIQESMMSSAPEGFAPRPTSEVASPAAPRLQGLTTEDEVALGSSILKQEAGALQRRAGRRYALIAGALVVAAGVATWRYRADAPPLAAGAGSDSTAVTGTAVPLESPAPQALIETPRAAEPASVPSPSSARAVPSAVPSTLQAGRRPLSVGRRPSAPSATVSGSTPASAVQPPAQREPSVGNEPAIDRRFD